jgi:hypothetical protein
MKKTLLIGVLLFTGSVIFGQKSIDALFEKYSDREGFVSLTLSGDLLKFVSSIDDDDDNPIPASVTQIRILAQENDHSSGENFYKLVFNDIRLDDYEEFMKIKKSDQDVRMMVRSEGTRFKEFLLIAGGEDNVIIQIKGNMTYSDARKFSNDAKKNHRMNLVIDHK